MNSLLLLPIRPQNLGRDRKRVTKHAHHVIAAPGLPPAKGLGRPHLRRNRSNDGRIRRAGGSSSVGSPAECLPVTRPRTPARPELAFQVLLDLALDEAELAGD